MAEVMLTLAAGSRTEIIRRIDENRARMIDGFLHMGAMLMLGPNRAELSPVEQLRRIQEADMHTPEDRRTIALTWGKRLAGSVEEEQFGEMMRHFYDNGDMDGVNELTLARIESLAKKQPKTP